MIEPGEIFYPSLGAVDWQQYLDTIWQRGRRKRVRETTRTLFLTNRRIIVVDESRMLKTDLPLADVEDVSVGMRRHLDFGRSDVTEALDPGEASKSAGIF